MKRPIALLDPAPREMAQMFTQERREELESLVDLQPDAARRGERGSTKEEIEEILSHARYVIGQTDLPVERLTRAGNLRAIINVESNFQPNVDYEFCFRNLIHVLSVSPVFAQPVAELGLGIALDLVRGISQADRAFRAGAELYGLEGNRDAFLVANATVGIIGYGDLGVALHNLISAFTRRVLVYDPWIPDRQLTAAGIQPAAMEEIFRNCDIVFVVTGATKDNEHYIGKKQFDLMRDSSVFVLLSRANVVDFDDLTGEARRGRIRIGTDVYPTEPLAPEDPIRDADTAVLSAHRAGALVSAFHLMGDLVVDDIRAMNNDLPPRRCKRAEYETVFRMRSAPVIKN